MRSVALAPSLVAYLLELTKPRITFLVTLTSLVGFVMASFDGVAAVPLAWTLLGTSLVAAGASALNMVLERDTDALMERTRQRPVAAGRLRPADAVAFGLFVTLDDMYVDGLVHISDLGQDYFQFDAHKHLLRGERTGVKYQLAGRVRVKVVRVNLEQAKIDFVLVAPPESWLAEEQEGGDRSPRLRDYDKKMKKLEAANALPDDRWPSGKLKKKGKKK